VLVQCQSQHTRLRKRRWKSDDNPRSGSHFLSLDTAFVVRRVLLLDGARTEEEDIDSSPCALRLVWYGRHVGDADESTEQIEWVEVWTYVSALDGAIYQPIAHGMNSPCTCQSSVVIRSKFTMRPPSSAFVAVTLPPYIRTMRSVIARPSPAPPADSPWRCRWQAGFHGFPILTGCGGRCGHPPANDL
jgi:hypothetical protein